MSKFIDADRLRAEIEKERKKALDSTKRGGLTISDIATADVLAEVLLIIEQLKKEQTETATGTVFTNPKPMNIIVENEQWEKLLGQFDNGQRVRVILVKEDAE